MKRFVKAIAKTSVGNMGSMLLRIVSIKVLAVTLGPQGIGLLSLLRQVMNVFGTISTFGGQKAIVQGIAVRQKKEYLPFLVSVLVVLVIGTMVGAMLLFGLAPTLLARFQSAEDPAWTSLLPWLVVPLFLNSLLVYLQGILNGVRAIGALAMTQVAQAGALALIAWPVSRLVSSGYPIAFILLISCGLLGGVLFAVYKIARSGFLTEAFAGNQGESLIRFSDIGDFIKFSWVLFFSLLMVMVAVLGIRMMATETGGLDSAGYFDSAWVISNTYLMFFTTSIMTYYFPVLAGMDNERDRYDLLCQALKLISVLVVPVLVVMIVFKPLVISGLYSPQFIPALEILRWMLIGGYLKMSGVCLGNLMLAKLDLKVYFWKQFVIYGSFFAASYYAFYYQNSIEGVGIAYCVMTLANLVFMLIYCSWKYGENYFRAFGLNWAAGFAIVIAVSILSWNAKQVDWAWATPCILLLPVASYLFMSSSERQHARQYVRNFFGKVRA